jgi:2-hydroxychromene-2-carboxylate isomerase
MKYGDLASQSRTCRPIARGISLRRVPLVIYYDFTSAESFAIHEIARAHLRPGAIDWRGVQVDETLPVPMMVLDRRARERLEMGISDAKKAWPAGKLETPRGMPNTKLALQSVASVERMHKTRADDFRAALFHAFWHRGEDLSDIAIVRRAADVAGVPPWAELGNQAAQGMQVSWELAWKTERLGGVPRVIRPDGQILWKVKSETEAREFLSA